jgi:DNA-binding NarL/FixJ family response regulator
MAMTVRTTLTTDMSNEMPTLSTRELAVLELLAAGYRYEQVALLLEVSLGTVRTYVCRAYRKLGVTTKSEATLVAMRRGLIR